MARAVSLPSASAVESWLFALWFFPRQVARLAHIAAVALLLQFTAAVHAQFDAPASLAVVRKVVGTCESRLPLSAEWSQVKEGLTLRPGQVLRCSAASSLIFSFSTRGISRLIDGDSPASATYTVPYVPEGLPEPREHLGGRIAEVKSEGPVRTTAWRFEMTVETEVRTSRRAMAVVSMQTLRINAVVQCASEVADIAANKPTQHPSRGVGMIPAVDRQTLEVQSARLCDGLLNAELIARRAGELATMLTTSTPSK